MLPPIPILRDYGIAPEYGFLPDVLPLERLPDPYYNKWEAIVANLQALVYTKRLRGVIDDLPVLSTVGLEHDAEWRRAYMLLAFMAHGYIWGSEIPSDRLPPCISIPFLKVSEYLEVPPVATYAAVCLWNFKPLFQDEPIDNLENIATLSTFTGSMDESWFYLTSIAIEARGGPILPLMLEAIAAARANDATTVTACLRSFAERLDELGSLLQRMHESCDPHIFYHQIRPFLAGFKNMAESGLPNGVIYDDGTGIDVYRQYAGGSNAQSSLIQFFDIILGIEHRPTGEKRDPMSESSEQEGTAPPPRHNFIHEMRRYMPGPHRRFLEDVTMCANIRDFVEARTNNHDLCLAYDACLAMLQAFRDKHLNIVARYIVLKSRQSRSRSRSAAAAGVGSDGAVRKVQKRNIATATTSMTSARQGRDSDGKRDGEKRFKGKGTGGTALMPFLKQARDETGEPAVEAWTRKVLNKSKRRADSASDYGSGYGSWNHGDFSLGKVEDHLDEEVEVNGLAGTWTMESDGGGLCHY